MSAVPTASGERVIKALYDTLPAFGPIRVLQYCVMPDHVHMILHVKERLLDHLGTYIFKFKTLCNKDGHLIDDGYNDQILSKKRKLDTLFDYVRDNPRRLAIKRANPRYFCSTTVVEANGVKCRCYGNILLLNNPFKEQVVVHRADTSEIRNRNKNLWEYTACNGGVLVSPFISRDEREVFDMAIGVECNIIYVTEKLPGEREKPHGRLFDLCAQGRLLMIAIDGVPEGPLTRQVCMKMNSLAASIAAGDFKV